MSEIEEFYRIGGEWARLQPESAWASGQPPKAYDKGFFVAVQTETGRILTGSLLCFSYYSRYIESQSKYGKIVRWIPFGEPS